MWRGVSPTAVGALVVAAGWVSRHASVTFNQYGREFPNGGMNDAGLVVEILWLDSSAYEPRDRRPTGGAKPLPRVILGRARWLL